MCVPAPNCTSPLGRSRIQSPSVLPGHSSIATCSVYGQRSAAAAAAAGVHNSPYPIPDDDVAFSGGAGETGARR